MTERERMKFVEKYIKNRFRNIEFKMNDNSTVVVTGTGATKIANSAYLKKARIAMEMKKLFNVAQYTNSDNNTKHAKFTSFDYYIAKVKIGELFYQCVLNVGKTKDSEKKQLYDINQINEIEKEIAP